MSEKQVYIVHKITNIGFTCGTPFDVRMNVYDSLHKAIEAAVNYAIVYMRNVRAGSSDIRQMIDLGAAGRFNDALNAYCHWNDNNPIPQIEKMYIKVYGRTVSSDENDEDYSFKCTTIKSRTPNRVSGNCNQCKTQIYSDEEYCWKCGKKDPMI